MNNVDATVEQAPTIQAALAAVMADVTHVGKEGKNSAQGYSFRGIDGVLNAVGPALRRRGVVVMPHLEAVEHLVVEVGKNRTAMRQATVTVRYVFHGPAGDSLDCVVAGEAMDSGDKATSKAMSVALRTALIQALALPTHEPDPDEKSYERAPAGRTDIGDVEFAGDGFTAAPQPPKLPAGVSPIDQARKTLHGEVNADGLKQQLNDAPPEVRGKVRARLEMAGLPTSLPDTLPLDKHAAITGHLEAEMAEHRERPPQ